MLNIDYESIHPTLRDLVKEYDNMSYQLLTSLYNARDTYNPDITINRYSKTIELLCDNIIISFYKNTDETFNIEIYVKKEYPDENQPLMIRHRMNDGIQKLEIEECLSKGGYAGVVNLNDLSDYFGKKDDEELEIIKSKLEKANKFMYNYSDSKDFSSSFKEDSNDIKKLVYIKNLLN